MPLLASLGEFFGGAAGAGIKSTLEGIGSLAKDIRAAVTGEISVEKKALLLEKAAELEVAASQGTLAINLAEAQNPSILVSGWRPALGWVCAISIGTYFIPQYVLATILWAQHSWTLQSIAPYPIEEPKGLFELVLLMLGFGSLRTFEAIKGVKRT